MPSDINEVTILVVVFLAGLGFLIFGMDWLEDRIDAPPSRLARWLRTRINQGGRTEGAEPDLPTAPPVIPQQRSPESAPLLPLASTMRETDQAPGKTSAP